MCSASFVISVVKMKELTINSLCRVCLKNSYFHSNIYKDHSMDGFLVYEVLNDVCALGISVNDGLPEFLCSECFIKMVEFESFKVHSHKGRSALLLLKEQIENPVVKQEELNIDCTSGDESEEPFAGFNSEASFGPILLKYEVLSFNRDNHSQESVESEESENVGEVELAATSIEDYTQLQVTLAETDLKHRRPHYSAKGAAHADSYTTSISEESKNISLNVEVEASSSETMKILDGQWTLPEERMSTVHLSQGDMGIRKEREETGRVREGEKETTPEKGVEQESVRLECCHCGNLLMTKAGLIQHMRGHGFGHTYDCDICGKLFQTNCDLQRHVLTHTGFKPYKCQLCSKSFSQNGGLKIHMSSHTGLKPYKCVECRKSFSNNSNLTAHMRSHTGFKPYKCAECCKSFSQRVNLRTHIRSHTGSKPYKCVECSKSFGDRSSFNRHKRLHTGSKPFKCAECSKTFSRNDNLETHMRSHTGSKPFKCHTCSKGFTQSCNLRKHLLVHTQEKCHECHNCRTRFSQGGNLNAHLQRCCKGKRW